MRPSPSSETSTAPVPGKVVASLVLGLSLFAVALPANAEEESAPSRTYVSVQLENDFLASTGDRYYTHGTQLSMLRDTTPPDWLDKVSGWVPFYRKGQELTLVNYTLGQKIFTPDDTESVAPDPEDRPYAGYLYTGFAVLSRISSSDKLDYGNLFEITLGIVGPSAMAEQTQNGFHELVDNDKPQGWDSQLKDEPAFGLSYSRFWRIVQPTSWGMQFGVNPHVTLAAGNVYTYGAGGVIFRLGDNLKRDLSPPNIRPGFQGLAYFRGAPEPSWYVFLGFESRLVLRDIFLDGNTFKQSPSVEKEHLVGDMQFGFVYLLGDMRITISNMLRTREYETQEENTHYGEVNFSFAY